MKTEAAACALDQWLGGWRELSPRGVVDHPNAVLRDHRFLQLSGDLRRDSDNPPRPTSGCHHEPAIETHAGAEPLRANECGEVMHHDDSTPGVHGSGIRQGKDDAITCHCRKSDLLPHLPSEPPWRTGDPSSGELIVYTERYDDLSLQASAQRGSEKPSGCSVQTCGTSLEESAVHDYPGRSRLRRQGCLPHRGAGANEPVAASRCQLSSSLASFSVVKRAAVRSPSPTSDRRSLAS